MGMVKNIGYNLYPKTSENIGKRVRECYVCDTNIFKDGIIVRDDIEEPFETIIQIGNHYIRSAECHFSTLKMEDNKHLKRVEYKYDNYPVQSKNVGIKVIVCYNFDTSKIDYGTIVRDDKVEPFETIIRLENGRYIRGVECQYRFANMYDEILGSDNLIKMAENLAEITWGCANCSPDDKEQCIECLRDTLAETKGNFITD